MERATGFEPVHRAWKARALPTELCPLICGMGRAGILPRGFLMPETMAAGLSSATESEGPNRRHCARSSFLYGDAPLGLNAPETRFRSPRPGPGFALPQHSDPVPGP